MSGAPHWPETPGIHDLEFEYAPGRKQRFTLALPAQTAGAPLVLALHYGGMVTPWYGRPLLEGLVVPALAPLAPLVCAPESLDGDWTAAANEQAVLALLDALERYRPDSRRRLVTGYSKGAIGTWFFASRHSARFGAAIPIAGTLPSGVDTCRLPTRVIHSRADSVFPAGDLEATLAALGSAANLTTEFLTGLDHFDVMGFRPALAASLPWLEEVWNATGQFVPSD